MTLTSKYTWRFIAIAAFIIFIIARPLFAG